LVTQFFFKATLLQQVNDLLQNIYEHLKSANALVHELEESIKPMQKELDELQGKIKNMEHVEEISQKVQQLKKKLAWSWVYDVDKQLAEQSAKIGILKDRIPACQAKIDLQLVSKELLQSRKFYLILIGCEVVSLVSISCYFLTILPTRIG
jgi:predicted RNase H-like nuclease (RuvC/YqgF family)